MAKHEEVQGKEHRFGGSWTDIKLRLLSGYLAAYTTALKGKPTPERPRRQQEWGADRNPNRE